MYLVVFLKGNLEVNRLKLFCGYGLRRIGFDFPILLVELALPLRAEVFAVSVELFLADGHRFGLL